VLECLELSFTCGGVGDDGNVMVAQPIRPALRFLSGAGRQLLFLHDVEIRSSTRVGGDARAVRLGPRISRGQTSRARRILVVAGACRTRRRLVEGVPLVGNWSEMQLCDAPGFYLASLVLMTGSTEPNRPTLVEPRSTLVITLKTSPMNPIEPLDQVYTPVVNS
jgi:hypothetical protein